MAIPRTLASLVLLSLSLSLSLGARTILIDSDDLTVTVGGAPYDFGGRLHTIKRLPDGVMEIVIKGDLVLLADDTVRGEGSFPVVFQVGNDAIIHEDAVFDFSGIEAVSGAGGGNSPDGGGPGGRGGKGGAGGKRGFGGISGIGGLSYSDASFPPGVSATAPGIPASNGFRGRDGKVGEPGGPGKTGPNGAPGFGAYPTSFGRGGPETAASVPVAQPGDGGSGGKVALWPAPIYFSGPFFRDLFWGGLARAEGYDLTKDADFQAAFMDGADGEPGTSAEHQPQPAPADPGEANGGKGAPHLADPWVLSAGSSGGGGSGGAGGPGGPGGGGGGGGAGGQGEWKEPVPTSLIAVTTTIKKNPRIQEIIKAYKEQADEEDAEKPKKKLMELGATGAWGGIGDPGGYGSNGGTGGRGGSGGVGGGALQINAQGRIVLDGGIWTRGGDGIAGSPAGTRSLQARYTPIPFPNGPGIKLPGIELSLSWKDLLGSVATGTVGGLLTGIKSGDGGTGAEAGAGGLGADGFPGGKGGGGSAGTIIMVGSEIEGSGRFDIRGGNEGAANPAHQGADGRIFLGANSASPDTAFTDYLNGKGFTVTTIAPAPPDSQTRAGTVAPNPFIAGLPETPTILDLPGGAEAFGFLSNRSVPGDPSQSNQLLINNESLAAAATRVAMAADPDTEEGAVLAAVRVDEDPRPGVVPFPGYDLILVFNPRTSPLSNLHFGVNTQAIDPMDATKPDPASPSPYHAAKLREGGWQHDPFYGGTEDVLSGQFAAGTFDIYAFYVPEDTATHGFNFTMSAEATPVGGGENVIYRKEVPLFRNLEDGGEYLVITFNADIPVYDAEWVGPDMAGADGNWNNADHWATTDEDGNPVVVVPNNSSLDAYNVSINLGNAQVTQDTSVTIDRLGIGATNGLFVQDGQVLILEKFYVRENAGVIENNGLIHLEGITPPAPGSQFPPTSLFFSGTNQLLTGSGQLTATISSQFNDGGYNLVAGLAGTDSLIQDLDHTMRFQGDLGGDSLQLTNHGTIIAPRHTHGGSPEPHEALVINPSGDQFRPSPGFLNSPGGRLGIEDGQAQLVLEDGHFRNEGSLAFDASSSPQTLTLRDARFVGHGETYQPVSQNRINIQGVSFLENVHLHKGATGGSIMIEDADLSFKDSNILLGIDSRNITVSNSTLRGADLRMVDPGIGQIFRCGEDPSIYEDFEGGHDPFFALFSLKLEGDRVTLHDTRIGGHYCFDRVAAYEVPNLVGYYAPVDHVTLRVDADELQLRGRIDNNGFVNFRRYNLGFDDIPGYDDTGNLIESPSRLLIDGQVTVAGTGAWGGPSSDLNDYLQTEYSLAGSNAGSLDTLDIGSEQVFMAPIFDFSESPLLVENHGQIHGAETLFDFTGIRNAYRDTVVDEESREEFLRNLREPLIISNRGVIAPGYQFGGGTIDNSGGTIALASYNNDTRLESILHGFPQVMNTDIPPTKLQNLRVLGGEVSTMHYKGSLDVNALLEEWAYDEAILAFNTEFDGVRFTNPRFDPSSTIEDIERWNSAFLPDIEGEDHGNKTAFGFVTLYQSEFRFNSNSYATGTGPATPIILNDVSFASHFEIDGVVVRGNLTLEPNILGIFGSTFLGEGARIVFDEAHPPLGIYFTNGLAGVPGSTFTVPPGIPFFAEGDFGGDSVIIENLGNIIYHIEAASLSDVIGGLGRLTLDPPGGRDDEVGFINRGTIGVVVRDAYIVGELELKPGHYDNTGGTISFAYGTIDGALIEGGILEGFDNEEGFEKIVNCTNGVILRDVEIRNLDLRGDFTLDNCRVISGELPNSEFGAGSFGVGGTVDLVRGADHDPGPGVPHFNFTGSPTTTGQADDRLHVADDVHLHFAAAGGATVTSLFNEGTITGGLTLTTPTLSTGFTLDDPTIRVVLSSDLAALLELDETELQNADLDSFSSTLGELGLDGLTLDAVSTITNTGAIGDANSDLLISDALLNNDTGTIHARALDLRNAHLRNLDGTIRAEGEVSIFNSIIDGGTLDLSGSEESLRIVDSFSPGSPRTGNDAITAFSDIDLILNPQTILTVEGATFALVGTMTGGAGTFMALLDGATFLIAGDDTTVEIGDVETEIGTTIVLENSTLVSSTLYLDEIAGKGTMIVDSAEIQQISPGFSSAPIGTLSIAQDPARSWLGNLDLVGSLEIDLGGTEAGVNHDLLALDGDQVILDEVPLRVSLLDGYQPDSTDTFTIVTSTSGVDALFASLDGFRCLESGDRILSLNGGSFRAQWGPESEFDSNHIVLSEYEPYLYVDASAPPFGDGSSWEHAIQNLPDAVAAAAGRNISEIRVADGTYTGAIELRDHYTIYGGYPAGGGPRDGRSSSTIFTGEISGKGFLNTMIVRATNVSPGVAGTAPFGAIQFRGGYLEPLPGSTLQIDIGGTEGGVSYDRISGFRSAIGLNLMGDLQITLQDGFVPHPDDRFEFFDGDGVRGAFSNAPAGSRIPVGGGGSFEVLYDEDLGVELANYLTGSVHFVDPDATGNNDGSSWHHAFTDLQSALAVAGSGDEVWVSSGTYYPAAIGGSKDWSFQLDSGVEVYGGFAGTENRRDLRDWSANPTILSGDIDRNDVLDSNNSYHVVYIPEPDPGAPAQVLDGFTITRGYASGATSGDPRGRGGAMVIDLNAAPILRNLHFYQNRCNNDGGAVMVVVGGTAVPIFRDCSFEDNDAADRGGAVYNWNRTAEFIDCVFLNNNCPTEGGAMFSSNSTTRLDSCFFETNSSRSGGAVFNSAASLTVSGCTFLNNSATSNGSGGAIFNNVNSDTTIKNCAFLGNSATTTGGALRNRDESDVTIVNSLFVGNKANSGGLEQGGAIWNGSFGACDLIIINSTFVGNEASSSGAIHAIDVGVTVRNSIFWDNLAPTNPAFGGVARHASSSHNLIQGAAISGDVIANTDPLFFDANGPDNLPGSPDDDLRLRPGSPALDVGDNTATTELLDFDGLARIQNGTIDLGAHEGRFTTFALSFPGLDPFADDNFNGYSNFIEYLGGADPAAPHDPDVSPTIQSAGGSINYILTMNSAAVDGSLNYEKSNDLQTFFPMVEGIDYNILSRTPLTSERDRITLELLFDPDITPRMFFRHGFLTAP